MMYQNYHSLCILLVILEQVFKSYSPQSRRDGSVRLDFRVQYHFAELLVSAPILAQYFSEGRQVQRRFTAGLYRPRSSFADRLPLLAHTLEGLRIHSQLRVRAGIDFETGSETKRTREGGRLLDHDGLRAMPSNEEVACMNFEFETKVDRRPTTVTM